MRIARNTIGCSAGQFALVLAVSAGSVWAQCAVDWTAPFEVGGPALDSNVFALCTWDPDGPGPGVNHLAVGGTFSNAGGQPALRTATFDGTWHAMNPGIASGGGSPSVMISWDPDGPAPTLPEVAMGGFFAQVAGITVRNVAHWNGTAWSGFGAGTQDSLGFPDVYCAAMWDPDAAGPLPEQLVIGGGFSVAGGQSRRRIARWDGAAWQAFGNGLSDEVYAITTWDQDGPGPQGPSIVVGGFFQASGTTSTPRIAIWNGTTWSGLGTGMDGIVEALTTWDPDGAGPQLPQLIAAGSFNTAGGVPAAKIARFDGTWHAMGSGMNSSVFALTTWDPDGSGPLPSSVIAGGAFATAGGVAANRVARWDGSSWSAVGTGMDNTVFELITWDSDGTGPTPEGLVAGGVFTTAGGVTSGHIAFFGGCTVGPACDTIDFNADGLFPDTVDIDDFLSVFSGGACSNDPLCGDIDFNNDGLFPDTADIDALLSVFSGGPCL